jgi:hypothetical protein
MTSPQYTTGPTAAGPQHYYGSTDEPTLSYTRSPPAYVDDEALLGGAPRSSEDNVSFDSERSADFVEKYFFEEAGG